MFVITNGRGFIGVNSIRKAVSVSSLERALCFEDKTKACNFLDNLPKEFKNIGYYCEEIGEEKVVDNQEDIIKIEEIKQLIPQLVENWKL